MEINAGGGSHGFSIKNGHFVWSERDGFGGWLGEYYAGLAGGRDLLTSLAAFSPWIKNS